MKQLLIILFIGAFTYCSDSKKINEDSQRADLVLAFLLPSTATVTFLNEKDDPICDYEVHISSGGKDIGMIPETATGDESAAIEIPAGIANFELHCEATSAEVEGPQDQTIEAGKNYELHAEDSGGPIEFHEI